MTYGQVGSKILNEFSYKIVFYLHTRDILIKLITDNDQYVQYTPGIKLWCIFGLFWDIYSLFYKYPKSMNF